MTPVEIKKISPTTINILVCDSYNSFGRERPIQTSELVDKITSWIIGNFDCIVNSQAVRNEVYSNLRNSFLRREDYLRGSYNRGYDDTNFTFMVGHLIQNEFSYLTDKPEISNNEKGNESAKRRKKLLLLLK